MVNTEGVVLIRKNKFFKNIDHATTKNSAIAWKLNFERQPRREQNSAIAWKLNFERQPRREQNLRKRKSFQKDSASLLFKSFAANIAREETRRRESGT